MSSVVRERRKPSALMLIGIGLVLLGLVGLGYTGFQFFGTNVIAEDTFNKEKSALRDQWSQSSQDKAPVVLSKEIPGTAVALLRIPKFGADYEVPLIKGTDLSVLNKGVGIYDQSVAPGEIGNFSIAGHRVTHGEPFRRLLELQKGDEIIVETRVAIYTYVLDTAPADLTVDETAGWVLDPVPGKPDEEPTTAMITITTCQDFFRSPDRSVAFGHLESTVEK